MRCWGAALVGQYVGATDGVVAWAERARVPRGRIRVIENGIETSRYRVQHRAAPPEAERAPRLLTGIVVANVRPEKGIEVLLRAMARVARHRRPLIWICGAARDAEYERRCREITRTLGLQGAVRFLGERGDTVHLIAHADFGVIPSISESGPLVLAEFLAAGLPVVGTEAGSLARRALSLGARDFVPPGDEPALAEAIERLIGLTPAERAARGEQGRALAERHFDIAAVMPRWHNVYGDALRRGRP
jgi:glycosyltransferase involved in cell wall biosynthesis